MKNKKLRYTECFLECQGFLMRSVYRIVEDREAAEDICHEAFLRLTGCGDELDLKEPKAWLLQTAKHLAFDYLRKGGKYQLIVGLEGNLPPGNWEADDSLDPCRILEKKEDENCRLRILERLKKEKPLWYEVICMSYMEDMKNQEIADTLGISYDQVAQWKSRAKKWLMDAYQQEERDS